MARVYCAGPLFNEPERREMALIAEVMEAAGHETFLPHRDGPFIRLRDNLVAGGRAPDSIWPTLRRAIFALDVNRLLSWSSAVVVNLNGRVPDEGTIVEVSLAWHGGKTVVLYKNDARALEDGGDNPMLLGLGEFRVCASIEELPAKLERAEARMDPGRVPRTLALGEEVVGAIAAGTDDPERLYAALTELVGGG